jgi:hypothetical protein
MAGAFPAAVERWRPNVADLVNASALSPSVKPQIVQMFLANVHLESQGTPGKVGYTDTGSSYTDAEIACGLPAWKRARALGLGQVVPGTLRSYNARHGDKVSPCDLAGTSDESGRKQLAVSWWVLLSCLGAVGLTPTTAALDDEMIRMARLCYARGIEATFKKRATAIAAGYPGTFGGMEMYAPKWGAPDRPFLGARRLLAEYKRAIGQAPTIAPPDAPSPTPGPIQTSDFGAGAMILLLLAALYFFKDRR